MSSVSLSIVVPAYQPEDTLVELVHQLAAAPVSGVVVVNDGSGPEYTILFGTLRVIPKVHVLEHATNLGKGAALKTGINYALCTFQSDLGVVTADSDGQHAPEDVLRIASRLRERPDALVLGVREFKTGVPLRSRFGNIVTRAVLRAVAGQTLKDAQTGLRGIPRHLALELLRVPSTGYEFEIDMLVASKHQGCPVVQEPIRTIYLESNRSSHFNPLLDSMRIYFVLLRFGIISALTAFLDNVVFFGAFLATKSLWQSQVVGRLAAMAFNYSAARRAAFLSRESYAATLPKYLLLVAFNGVLSYAMISFLMMRFEAPVVWAKLLAETTLFIANFTIQRDFIFVKGRDSPRAATDWTQYYGKVPSITRLARRYTTRTLLSAIRPFVGGSCHIVEIGGANSCFVDDFLQQLRPRLYHVIDNNQYGLDLLQRRIPPGSNVTSSRMDVRDVKSGSMPEADLVFSVGLVEHFDPEGTRQAIEAHFDLLAPGGYALISFPTPTWLYRTARAVTEAVGAWKFPDERPLSRQEVLQTVDKHGEVIFEKTLWPLVFTQRMLIARKRQALQGRTGA